MKKIILFGNGSYAKTLTYYIENTTDWEIVAYCTDLISIETTFNNKPYVPLCELLNKYAPKEYEIVMGIGYRNMNNLRKEKFNLLKGMGYTFANLIHPSAILNNTILGEGNIILENVVIEPNTVLGNNIIIWSATLLGHDGHIGSHSHFAACSLVAGNVKIGENCFLGNHSTVKDGIEIADYTLLGAGVYVSKNTQKYDVVVPARAVTLNKRKSTDYI